MVCNINKKTDIQCGRRHRKTKSMLRKLNIDKGLGCKSTVWTIYSVLTSNADWEDTVSSVSIQDNLHEWQIDIESIILKDLKISRCSELKNRYMVMICTDDQASPGLILSIDSAVFWVLITWRTCRTWESRTDIDAVHQGVTGWHCTTFINIYTCTTISRPTWY